MTDRTTEALAILRAYRIATTAAEELITSEAERMDEADTYRIPCCQADEHMRDCIEHLKWVGNAMSWETADGYIMVQLGDFTLEGLA
ncbi:MAG: hypothetical protein ACK40S_03500 [Burkholderiaceae bacterium]